MRALAEKPKSSQPILLQPKLTIGAPGDIYEQEADRAAAQVMRPPERHVRRHASPRTPLQERRADESAVPPVVRDALSSPGQPLDSATRGFMEPRFGHDFSKVRVHADSRAGESARALDARAYTAGTDVVFGANEYAPGTTEGRRLIAHELAHTLQQNRLGTGIQRSPYTGINRGTDDLHDRLRRDYQGATGSPSMGGVQYTQGYERWLLAQREKGVNFVRPKFVRVNPLERLRQGRSTGSTTLVVNGQPINGGNLGANQTLLLAQLQPTHVVQSPGLVTGQVSCRFGPQFGIETSAEVTEATPPSASGWHARLPAAALRDPVQQRPPQDCVGKSNIPVTLRGRPDAAYQRLVHDSEMEHVHEIEVLHNRHFVPYYNFIKTLSATAGNAAACETSLRQRISPRDEQTANAFLLADLAETRKYDDPSSTHHSGLIPTITGSCTSVTLTPVQTNPQQAGAGPGNVRPVAPQVQAVTVGNLSVSGSSLMDGTTLIRAFASPADAATAMGMMATYGITEIQRIGSFEILLSNGQPPSGALAGIRGLDIDPDAFQVTAGFPNIADWIISQTLGANLLTIVDFGAQRDQAYAAVGLMRRHRVTRKSWIGPEASPQMMFFTV